MKMRSPRPSVTQHLADLPTVLGNIKLSTAAFTRPALCNVLAALESTTAMSDLTLIHRWHLPTTSSPNQADLFSLNGPQILRLCYASIGPATARSHPPVPTTSPGFLHYQKPTFDAGALTWNEVGCARDQGIYCRHSSLFL